MFKLVLSLFLLHGVPQLTSSAGTVSGVLRTTLGTPAEGVRVVAVTPPQLPGGDTSESTLVSLAETDSLGRYRLENIPPGRYYIAAGRIDGPTYFPGTLEMTSGNPVLVTAQGNVSGVDFVVRCESSGRSLAGMPSVVSVRHDIQLHIRVTIEGASTLPVFASGGFVRLRLTNPRDGRSETVPITSETMTATATGSRKIILPPSPTPLCSPSDNTETKPAAIVNPQIAEYRISIDSLSDGYSVKSIIYGNTDITNGTLKIGLPDLPPETVTVRAIIGGFPTVILSGTSGGRLQPEETLAVVLKSNALSAKPGVRVTGHIKDASPRSIYIDGESGILYADGTFEFRNVLPGRHSIVAGRDSAPLRLHGQSIIIGNTDLSGVELVELPVIPISMPQTSILRSAGPSASVPSLATLRGRVLDADTAQPITEGSVSLSGYGSAQLPIGSDGQFQIQYLLPGDYKLELKIFGHTAVSRSIQIGDEDLNLDISAGRL